MNTPLVEDSLSYFGTKGTYVVAHKGEGVLLYARLCNFKQVKSLKLVINSDLSEIFTYLILKSV